MGEQLIVIGAGVGGYVAAIRAAQLGLKVTLVDANPVSGGTCLNVGCIPSKALLEASDHYEQALHGLAAFGVKVSGVELDLPTMMGRKEQIVRQLTDGLTGLFEKNRVTRLTGRARLAGPGKVEITPPDSADGTPVVPQLLDADHIILATGSVPIELPDLPFDGTRIVRSEEALSFDAVPRHLVVIGAGAIGLELGSVWARLGSKVTVVELLPRILPSADRQVASTLQRALKEQGLDIRLKTRVVEARPLDDGLELTLQSEGATPELLVCDRLLVAVGRRAYSAGLGLETVGLAVDGRGALAVDDQNRTAVPGIWAIGDLVAGPMLAHRASAEGVAVAERIAGHVAPLRRDTIPNVVYTAPELATVGMSDDDARAAGHEVKVGRALLRANGRAMTLGRTEGIIKIVADARTDRLLGVHILAPHASDLIAEAVTLLEFSASTEDLARIVHAHPTLAEALHEAALDADKIAIHA